MTEEGGECFKRNVDLYDLLEELQESGFSTEDLGILYVSAVASLPRRILLSETSFSIPEKVVRHRKKYFEENVRKFFKNIRNEIVMGGADKEKVMNAYFFDWHSGKTQNGTIESAINSILKKDTAGNFLRIGEAVVSGARQYLSEKPKNLGAYKVFLEYNRIQKKLNDLVQGV